MVGVGEAGVGCGGAEGGGAGVDWGGPEGSCLGCWCWLSGAGAGCW